MIYLHNMMCEQDVFTEKDVFICDSKSDSDLKTYTELK